MSKYKLIAFDMDGTLLNSKKEISQKTLDAIDRAFDEGKEVILSTGRCVAELNRYIVQLPRLRYINCVSGALVYDLKEKKNIYSNAITPEKARKILEASKLEDCMPHIMTTHSIVQEKDADDMAHFRMGVYQDMFSTVTDKVDDIYSFYNENNFPVEKLNLYHYSVEGRDRSRERLSGLGLVLNNSERTGLEMSAEGVTKGTGLIKLCEYLGISVDETIAVGDADNDIDVLKTAGLSIAMDNAEDSIKDICDVVVSDCDSDGCVEAIEKYLLD